MAGPSSIDESGRKLARSSPLRATASTRTASARTAALLDQTVYDRFRHFYWPSRAHDLLGEWKPSRRRLPGNHPLVIMVDDSGLLFEVERVQSLAGGFCRVQP